MLLCLIWIFAGRIGMAFEICFLVDDAANPIFRELWTNDIVF